jgi:acyl-CoA synthetase (AMP-forming)/AMP-acid ligase II
MAGYRPQLIRSLDCLLDESAGARPTAPALITGPERMPVTYRELAALVNKTAETLAANDLRPGGLVALEAANSVEFVVGLLAAARARLVVAPLDPNLAREERASRLDRLGARVILVDAAVNPDDGPCPAWPLTFTSSRATFQVTVTRGPRTTPASAPGLSENDGLVMFTAGTTGQPKMVPWTRASITAVISDICACYKLSPADATVAVMPFFHGHGLVACLLATLASSGCVLLPERGRFAAHTFWKDMAAARVTWFTAVPTIIEILLARAATEHPADPGTRLRFVRTCSAPLNAATALAFGQLAGAPVLDAYGMTETTHQAASQPLPADGSGKPGSVGRPTGVQVRIAGDDGRQRPAGTAGEVWVKGPTVTRGYLADPVGTAGSFTDGWYHTGDLGILDADGYLTVTGRIKTLINRGGEKISPEHVEEILDQHPAVAESAVLGQPDPTLGERVVALVVLASGQDFQASEVLDSCRRRLARYEIPEDIRAVDRIPHTAKGAIDRSAVLAAYQNPV